MNRSSFVAGSLAKTVIASPRARAAVAAATDADVIGDLVTANHILAHEGVVDGFGHVSVRDPRNGPLEARAAAAVDSPAG